MLKEKYFTQMKYYYTLYRISINSNEMLMKKYWTQMIDNPYSYHWQQISAPEGSHGYMEGQDSRRVTLSQVYMYIHTINSFQKIIKANN